MRSPSQDPALVIIGAGMTGRGHVAQLAAESGWKLIFIDSDAALVGKLKAAGRYTVRLVGTEPRDVVIDSFDVVHTSESEGVRDAFVRADLVVTSVRAQNLPDVARTVAMGLQARFERQPRPLDIICAENAPRSSTRLAGYVRQVAPPLAGRIGTDVGFPDSMIARVVPAASDVLLLYAENYNEWTADARAFRAGFPAIGGLECVHNQQARLQRKLYVHNTGHATAAFWGLLAGYRYIHEAARDSAVAAMVQGTIAESAEAVRLEHGFPQAEIAAYRDGLLPRLRSDALPDELVRVARDPIRKLGPTERIFGPIGLCLKHGITPRCLARTAAAALLVRVPGDSQSEKLARMMGVSGPLETLRQILGRHVPSAVAPIIEAQCEKLWRKRV